LDIPPEAIVLNIILKKLELYYFEYVRINNAPSIFYAKMVCYVGKTEF